MADNQENVPQGMFDAPSSDHVGDAQDANQEAGLEHEGAHVDNLVESVQSNNQHESDLHLEHDLPVFPVTGNLSSGAVDFETSSGTVRSVAVDLEAPNALMPQLVPQPASPGASSMVPLYTILNQKISASPHHMSLPSYSSIHHSNRDIINLDALVPSYLARSDAV